MALLTVDEAAKRLTTKPRFIRRLIAEKRIAYVKLGGHVRIEDTAIEAFIAAGRVSVPGLARQRPSTEPSPPLAPVESRHHDGDGRINGGT